MGVVESDRAAEDRRLVGRIAAGDPAALDELYERYGRVVFGVLYRMLASPEVAEEVTQDAFHSIWRQARTYRSERGAVKTWLLAICRNAAIDWRRTKGRRLGRETTIDAAAQLATETPVEDRVLASLRAQRINAAVGDLPPEQREVVSLAFWSGLSQTEISQRTGVALGTVKSRVRLAMAKLRDRLGAEDAL
ncbi:MAG: RNA polymerase sigma factor [Thermoleophilaceae bacterium]